MKKLLTLLIVVLLFSLTFAQQKVKLVPATDDQGNPIVDALITYVVADTANGKQLHDVYKLESGKMYAYTQAATFSYPITLIADEGAAPPRFYPTEGSAGFVWSIDVIRAYADLTIKNVSFTRTAVNGTYLWGTGIALLKDGIKMKLEGCIFEHSGWTAIVAQKINTSSIVLDKCTFRNMTVPGSGNEWCEFVLDFMQGGSIDTLILRNNTFFNVQGNVVNIGVQYPIKHYVVDHNTFVNVVKGFSALEAHLNTQITNNIFYNVGAHGNLLKGEVEKSKDQERPNIIRIDTLTGNLSDTLVAPMKEDQRRVELRNNVYFFSNEVKGYFDQFKWDSTIEDSLIATVWMAKRAKAIFANNTVYSKVVESGTVNEDPKFVKFGGTNLMVEQMVNHRKNKIFGFWGWDTEDDAKADPWHFAVLEWPLPENFAYTANLPKGTHGYSVGSLQWYPSEMAQYYSATSINDNDNNSLPVAYELKQNYPNPFNPSTTIEAAIPVRSTVSIKVFNLLGQEVANLLNEVRDAGSVKVNFNASNLSSGVYFYRLEATPVDSGVKTVKSKKMLLVK